jgi:hypothetical protein
MDTRNYNTYHHSMLTEWWIAHKWSPIPGSMLPPNGSVIYDDATPVCAGFIYKTDSDIAWMEFIVSNPSSTKEQRTEALPALIADLTLKAKALGAKCIFTSCQSNSLIAKHIDQGFVKSDEGMTNLVKPI